MFFDGPTAWRVLAQLQSRVRPGGVIFTGWTILVDETHEFPAPHGTVKRFSTVVARRPAARALP